MASIVSAVHSARDSLVALLRVHTVRAASAKKGRARPPNFGVAIVGSAFCIVANRYLVTAYHVFNDGKKRDPNDKFYAFVVPQNRDQAFYFPVIGFPVEDVNLDLALVEVGPPTTPGITIPAVPVTFTPQPDGARVLTFGFPAPAISRANLDPRGNWAGGEFFLKSHANEGIVSAQYDMGGMRFYELNVGWHHGESGGPILRLDDPVAAFSVMQHYRNIKSPHGIAVGPHRGRSLVGVEQSIRNFGANVVE